jgi:hypothetical protein
MFWSGMPLTLQSKRVTKKTKVDTIQVTGDLAAAFYLAIDLAKLKMEDTPNFMAILKSNYGDKAPQLEAELEAFLVQVEEGRPADAKDFICPRSSDSH